MRLPPNIVFITWHDAGRWFGCYGNRQVHTPNVDRLAAEGCRFSNTFAACAICSPSRAAIATGRYCQDNGVMFLTNTVNDNRLHRDERHIARLLREAGYRTALFGVQHECAHEHVTEIMQVHERFGTDPWPTAEIVADHACRWIARRANEPGPFYAQVGFFEAHHPFDKGGCRPDRERGVHIPPYLADTEATRENVALRCRPRCRLGDALAGRAAGGRGRGRADDAHRRPPNRSRAHRLAET